MNKKLYRFDVDFGRMGELEGIFFAHEEDLKALVGKEIYLGDVLGRHSDIDITFNMNMVTLVDMDDSVNRIVRDAVGSDTLSGINPLEYDE